MRQFTFSDYVINEIDIAIRTLVPPLFRSSPRQSPSKEILEPSLTVEEKKHVAGLMRVNHAGEVCARALYQGQSYTAVSSHIKKQMTIAAEEEIDHLAWCEERLKELGSHPSRLNVIWYAGSLMIGVLAGLKGDKFSLGFVVETENQVHHHLQKHLERLPLQDKKTRAILKQMQKDEAEHAATAKQAGAADLPLIIKRLMSKISLIMTKTSYHI